MVLNFRPDIFENIVSQVFEIIFNTIFYSINSFLLTKFNYLIKYIILVRLFSQTISQKFFKLNLNQP